MNDILPLLLTHILKASKQKCNVTTRNKSMMSLSLREFNLLLRCWCLVFDRRKGEILRWREGDAQEWSAPLRRAVTVKVCISDGNGWLCALHVCKLLLCICLPYVLDNIVMPDLQVYTIRKHWHTLVERSTILITDTLREIHVCDLDDILYCQFFLSGLAFYIAIPDAIDS